MISNYNDNNREDLHDAGDLPVGRGLDPLP